MRKIPIKSKPWVRLEEEPRREEDSALGADVEERPSQTLTGGVRAARSYPLADVIVFSPRLSGHRFPSVLDSEKSWTCSAPACKPGVKLMEVARIPE
jgi:hypothetical protein